MIEPNKLHQLSGGQKRRKLALTFGALERDIAGIPEKGMEYNFPSMPREKYTRKITEILLEEAKTRYFAALETETLGYFSGGMGSCNCAPCFPGG